MVAEAYRTVDGETMDAPALWRRGYLRVMGLLAQAKRAAERGDAASKANLLSRAFAIVQFWQAALVGAGEPDGEMGRYIGASYDYLLNRIATANALDDYNAIHGAIDDATARLTQLAKAFRV